MANTTSNGKRGRIRKPMTAWMALIALLVPGGALFLIAIFLGMKGVAIIRHQVQVLRPLWSTAGLTRDWRWTFTAPATHTPAS